MHVRTPARPAAAVALAAVLALSACGSDDAEHAAPQTMTTVSASPTSTVSQTQSQSQTGNATATTSPGDGSSAPGSGERTPEQENCGVDPNAAAISSNIGQVPAPSLEGMSWIYKGDSNYDPCTTLSYATVEQSEQGNSQFQNQLMLFHKGEFLGVGSDTVQQHQVIGTTDDSVTVRYKDWEALDAAGAPNAEASNYTTDVTFRWNGSQVVPEGRFPNLDMQ